jgi:hypothetical protein
MPTTYTPIATNTLIGNATSVTFSSIPQTYTDLVLVTTVFSTSVSGWGMNFNSDVTSANYGYIVMDGQGSIPATVRQTAPGRLQIGGWSIATGSTTKPSIGITNILNYSNSTTYKTALSRSQVYNSTTGSGVDAFAGVWKNTASITSIVISLDSGTYNFAAGSNFTLYGIKAA